MARRNSKSSHLCRMALLAMVVMLLAGPMAAQTPTNNAQLQWQQLNTQAREAFQAGEYANGMASAEQALQLAREAFGPRHPATLRSLNNLAVLYLGQGRYDDAERLLTEALQGRREVLGARHPDTLGSLNNLASLYQAQGRYDDAESRFKEALQGYRETVGPRNPDTLRSLNNLAELYRVQERYGEAESRFKEALQGYREKPHPDMFASLNNLALLYQAQGRYGEAELLHRKALQGSRETVGPRHPNTLASLNNLAMLYQAQGRYDDAEPLFKEAQQGRREILGPQHPETLASLNNLALLYQDQGRYDDAEPLLKEALQGRREILGPHHPDTLASLNNLALLYQDQGRYDDAEPLLKEVLQTRRRNELDPQHPAQHPATLRSLNNLAVLYLRQGRYDDAEPLLKEALQGRREILGPHHPDTLATQLSKVALLINQSRPQEAVRTLQEMEPNLLDWIGHELYSTEGSAARRQLVYSQGYFQSVVLTLATTGPSTDAHRLAGTVMLRWKGLVGEEEAYLARLAHRSEDPRVRTLAGEVGNLRTGLAAAFLSAELRDRPNGGKPKAFEMALQTLEAKQLALGQVSRDYKDYLRVRTANLDDLRAALPADAVLIEFRQFKPFDFRSGTFGEPRMSAMLLAGFDEPMVVDVGPLTELRKSVQALLGQSSSMPADAAAAALYQRLFAPFESKLAAAKAVYLAPDGLLHLVPYSRLKLADGRYLEEHYELRILQTGRDLLRPDPDNPTRGLLAMGGIDFGAAASAAGKPVSVFVTAAGGQDVSGAITRTAETFRDGFRPLPASGEEAVQLKEWYLRYRKNEPAETWSGAAASEARLKALTSPPRVLHLATHGFYLPGDAPEPMLLSGVALAGANRALAKTEDDGILFALEAQGLNLDGSELVVLSACDSAKGDIDYSEGVYGLVRAFRTAGARNVLVTLWPVNDGEARDFMAAFYRTWLAQAGRSEPARALRQTRLSYLNSPNPALRNPKVWAPYVLVE